MTPLMIAAYYGRDDMVRLLVERGADTALKNNAGMSAAMLARESRFEAVAAFLDSRVSGGGR